MTRSKVGSHILGGLFLTLVLPAFIWAQTGTATLSGTVADPSGAIVPGVQIVVTNVATGVSKNAVTTTAGLYVIPNLIPGTYNLTASAKGFERRTITGVTLEVDQAARIDVDLKVGEITQSVDVTGENAALLQTESSSVGAVISSQQVVDLPLNGRYFTQLMVLSPGTIPATTNPLFSGTNPVTSGDQRNGVPAFNVAGQSGGFTEFRIDGSENVEPMFGGANIPISIDAIQEFKIQTSNFSAEYGRSPVQVDVVTKSGTNQFHGGLYEFLRNDMFDAPQWSFVGLKNKNLLKRNQFGGDIGGPIKKNKLFFFFSYEGNREIFSAPQTTTVPSLDMRNGIFPSGVRIFDPSNNGAPFPNNTISPSNFNPITLKVLNMVLPAPNLPGIQLVNSAGFALEPTQNYFFNPQRRITMNQYNARGDYTISEKDSVSVRYTNSSLHRVGEGPLATGFGGLVGTENANLGGTNLSSSWYRRVSASIVNQFTFAFDTDPQNTASGTVGSVTDWASVLGVKQFLPSNAFLGLPEFDTPGFTLSSGGSRPLQVSEDNYQFVDNVSIARGKHFSQFGTDIRRTHLNTFNSNNSKGVFGFNGAQTRDRAFPSTPTTYCPGGTSPTACTAGDGFADFLLGDLSSFQDASPIPPLDKYFSNWAFYFNDAWHVARKLTLNLGLRYEYQTRFHADPATFAMPYVVNGQFTGIIGLAQNRDGSLGTSRFQPQANTITPGAFVGCTHLGLPRSCLVSYKGAFQPRVGFAWQLDNKTVFRGAGGIFYGAYQGDLDTEDGEQYPMVISTLTPTFNSPPATGAAPLNINNPLALSSNPTPLVWSTAPRRKLPSTYEWNLAVQRQLSSNTTATVAYVASMNRHLDLDSELGFNHFHLNLPGPVGVVLAPGQKQVRPYPEFSDVLYDESVGTSEYESLQTLLERRFMNGLQFTATYTYSTNVGINPWLSDPMNYAVDRGPLNNDVTHNFLVSPIWNLPFGSGRRWANVRGPVNQIIGGWRLSGIAAWRSGFPFTPLLPNSVKLLGYSAGVRQNRPDRVCSGKISNPSAANWFDKNCFTMPVEPTTPGAALVPGNSGSNILRGPGQFSFDTGISKTFPMPERMGLDFRAEVFNVLNHPTLGLPNATIQPGNNIPAQITTPTSLPRIVQFALKLNF